jgi:O-methyltransferase involved in polyketide biosynthesis
LSDRDFSSISDTARWLLFLKAITDIPYAKQAAELIQGKALPVELFDPSRQDEVLVSTIGFEARYLSIDAALSGESVNNFLELSSGYSFRSLEMTKKPGVFYVDTDLPDIIEMKRRLVAELVRDEHRSTNIPEFRPLNALDENAFLEIVNLFPTGPVGIINEGLLIYLDEQEKSRLAATIHKVLCERGGFWLTGDIYVNVYSKQPPPKDHKISDRAREFLAKHRIMENMFTSWENAREFFDAAGFSIEPHKADEVCDRLTTRRLIDERPSIDKSYVRASLETRQTWVLRPLK